jgi:CheY-like chemotaxis protein
VLVVVTQDQGSGMSLLEAAHRARLKVLVATEAEAAFDLVQDHRALAVAVDLALPERGGWVVLDQIKHAADTRHLPVFGFSPGGTSPAAGVPAALGSGDPATAVALDLNGPADGLLARRLGAIGHAAGPVDTETAAKMVAALKEIAARTTRRLLIAAPDVKQRMELRELLGGEGVEIVEAATPAEAIAAVERQRFDCAVVAAGFNGDAVLSVCRKVRATANGVAAPVVVVGEGRLTAEQRAELRALPDVVTLPDADTWERVLDQTSLFLHRSPAVLPEAKRRMLEQARRRDPVLRGRHALVVDDDVRNVFALTTLLERYGMRVSSAEGGADSLSVLSASPDVDVVLMDVMMPGMDGFEAMHRIRAMTGFEQLPIIALTAKAMKEDRAKCLAAGASDYITKPVEVEKLLALLRVWLLGRPPAERPTAPEAAPATA